MKTNHSVKAIILAITILLLTIILGSTAFTLSKHHGIKTNNKILKEKDQIIESTTKISKPNIKKVSTSLQIQNIQVAEGLSLEEINKTKIVYDEMTLEQLADKLEKSLNSTISGQGYTFASKSIELGIDPYLAVAIMLHETGCKWECSSLMSECNNVGGMKSGGNGTCGSYARFSSLEEGINAYMDNLYKNYISQGLTTADAMASKYAASDTWALQVNTYINEIKAN